MAQDFQVTHECSRCSASLDKTDINNIKQKHGVKGSDCIVDQAHKDGHNYVAVSKGISHSHSYNHIHNHTYSQSPNQYSYTPPISSQISSNSPQKT